MYFLAIMMFPMITKSNRKIHSSSLWRNPLNLTFPTTCSTLLCFSSNCQQILVSYTENLLALFKITPNHKYLLDSFIHINNYWRITNSLYKMHESEAWQRKITIAVPFLKSRKNGIWLCNQILLKLVILIGLYAYNHCENVRISAIRKSS